MKKTNFQAILMAMLALGVSSAFASMNIPLGTGTIDGTLNRVATLQVKNVLTYGVNYDVVCTVNDPTGNNTPVKLRADVDGAVITLATDYTFDGKEIPGHQAMISDFNKHVFKVSDISFVESPYTNEDVKLMWLAGDDVSTPTSYDCYATPSVGLKA